VDSFYRPDIQPDAEPVEVADPAPTGIKGFVASRNGKLILGAVLLVLLLAVLGAIAYFTLLAPPQQSSVGGGVPKVPASTAGTSAVSPKVPTERRALTPQDVYTFRNIFEPTVKLKTPSAASSGETSQTYPANALVLQSISTQDGVSKANLYWNGSVYTLAKGDQISGTPWEVLSIDENSVVMLYGDSRVTLTVGQGIVK
jgi:hypothetical protein